MSVQRAALSGQRLHLQHGPIDLVIGAQGDRDAAFDAAEARLATVLEELMGEIDLLRQSKGAQPLGAIARLMWEAAYAHSGFVTPMAAVAGAVAQTVLGAMCAAADLQRAYVNNGGDIALHLGAQATFSVAMASQSGGPLGKAEITQASPVRGIATSGHGGRSLSLGIAQSVTVLAGSAAQADVAATLIANAVDLPGHPAIERAPASALREQSDLGDARVPVHVGALTDGEVTAALHAGLARAKDMQNSGLIHSASLHLRGQSLQVTEPKRSLVHA